MKIVSLLFITLISFQARSNEVLVLVPGFFNSFTPEYFSNDVVSAFTKKGMKTYVAKGLNPIGTIADNGSRLEIILDQIKALEGQKVQFNIVAHSAGGFYSLWVAHRQKFTIKNLYTISTPYKGVEFIQTWIDKSFLFRTLTELAYLEGLKELSASGVQSFLNTVRVSPETKIIAFGGFQEEGLDITDARNISVPLRVTSHFISSKSDGIVAYSSALGLGSIKTTESKQAQQFLVSNIAIKLEHWEQVLEPNAFIFLGVRNIGYIQREQIRFYSSLADYVLKSGKN
ncbi:MAG: hypothetical protein A2622_10065 [Bdellovibrionales bacterium RIFCSPHIGHO2_01_FULL_40_29]|nr:MAG: hypothetical protein A2622_10065 [Bdellovibrionales bacterium RIFCSPHIGHO2_01_FULL_40_29]OFZ32408.1 MAG: hypothetical protein A3D17_12595 [Bdellovibrionales bacterium RIFCSPHIGHO2_02_FULL_40_15]